ncbi:MAG: hypothetical protein ACJAVM_000822 [Sulfitobacter sp.]|jgi:hypothetical protein
MIAFVNTLRAALFGLRQELPIRVRVQDGNPKPDIFARPRAGDKG